MKQIVVAGETYSPNLGDGVIAESLAFLLQTTIPTASIRLLDISARPSWMEAPDLPQPNRLWALLRGQLASIAPIRQALRLLRWYAVKRPRYVPIWQAVLAGASTLVVGGGQVLMDDSLNFPLKVNGVAALATSLGLDLHFSACGVGKHWSPLAAHLFQGSLASASTITVRDAASCDRLQRAAPRIAPSVRVTADPAICAAEVYVADEKHLRASGRVGVGILGLHEVNTHAPPGRRFTRESLTRFWVDVLVELQARSVPFEVFTNGTLSDYAIAQAVRDVAQREMSTAVPLCPRPLRPRDLALSISRYQAAISTRLHGSIIALSYGIPAAGLAWDDKVQAFFGATGRADFCVSIYDLDPEAVVATLLAARQAGIDPSGAEEYRRRALENARVIASTLS